MMKNGFFRFTALFLAALMLVGSMSFAVSADDVSLTLTQSANTSETAEQELRKSSTRTLAELREILNTIGYDEYSEKHANAPYATTEVLIEGAKYLADKTTAKVEVYTDYEGDVGESLYLPDSGTVTWEFEVPESGKYTISVDYLPSLAKAAPIERMMFIDGKVPFSEARSVEFSKVWTFKYVTGADGNIRDAYNADKNSWSFARDASGNELRPTSVQTPEWRTMEIVDSAGFHNGALEIYFEAGTHTIAFEAVREPMVVKAIKLSPVKTVPGYAEVKAEYDAKGYKPATGAATVKIEAELPNATSDQSVYPTNDRTSAINSPQEPGAQVLNVLGESDVYSTVGQWARYEFEVDTDGLYIIGARYKQSDLAGMFTSRTIKINGEVPFAEAYNARFDYSKEWQCTALGDGNNTFEFYFEAGKVYTIELYVSFGELNEVLSVISDSLTVINNSYLEILKLTGSEPDKYRDYKFNKFIPETVTNLAIQYRTLTEVSKTLEELCGAKGSHVATLDKVAQLLKIMSSDQDKIAANLTNLKSYIGTLGTWLNESKKQPLTLDYLLIQSADEELPRATASMWQSFLFECKAFFASFFTDYSNIGATSDNSDAEKSIEVWLATGRDQAQIQRTLCDSYFTPESGIGVNVKLVAGGTILPSVLAGEGPDVYIGLTSADTINYAIRGAVLPITDMEGFDEIASEFTAASMVPLSLYGETYGLPEQLSFPMMFYRKDILADLGVEIPKTWDDVLATVTVLQANNMEVGLSNGFYNMFLYQMGGNLWADDGMRIGLDTNEALNAFEYFCNFFTMYSFPYSFDAANRFRTGEMPIVFADYVTMYNQLTVFATEINGLWEFVPMPGIQQADGSINNQSVASVTSVVMMNGVKDAESAWAFMKWQAGSDAQSKYANDLVATIGPAAKFNTANVYALEEMPWTTSEYENLLSQFNSLTTIENYPGSYIIARYVEFAFLDAYNEGADPADALLGYINTINKEITRKREEFDLETLELGQTLAEKRALEAENGKGE
jgi:ABC-type glycerol-3-phosphate transport system substrate-binding protein